MKECGKENFDPKTCLKCTENYNCIIELAKERDCGLFSSKNGPMIISTVCYNPTTYGCTFDQQKICQKVSQIIKCRINTCRNFGKPKENEIKGCIDCYRNTNRVFQDCEIHEILLKDLELSFEEASRIVKREINKLESDPEDCFGQFAFEETCWQNCEFKIRCMMKSGIYKGKECKLFPDFSQHSNLPDSLEEFCPSCIYYEDCFCEFEEIHEKTKRIFEEKKMFRNFFSLGQIREQFIKED